MGPKYKERGDALRRGVGATYAQCARSLVPRCALPLAEARFFFSVLFLRLFLFLVPSSFFILVAHRKARRASPSRPSVPVHPGARVPKLKNRRGDHLTVIAVVLPVADIYFLLGARARRDSSVR